MDVLRVLKKIFDKKIIIWGTGSASEKVIEYLPIKIEYFVDNAKKHEKTFFKNKPLKSSEVLLAENQNQIAIIVASQYFDEIAKQLEMMGFSEYVHFWNGLRFLKQEESNQYQYELKKQNEINDMRYRDILTLLQFKPRYEADKFIELICEETIAEESIDHLIPHGAANDNTRWPAFVKKCEEHFYPELAYLDLGCSGGGMVFDFALRGHFAMGLEGSDYSKRRLRSEWRTIPNNLFICNIAKPFSIILKKKHEVMRFDVISAWEVLEHLSMKELKELFQNVKNHLKHSGFFIGSVSTQYDGKHHVTVKPKQWWEEVFLENGFVDLSEQQLFIFEDFPRGNGNFNSIINFKQYPEAGFHFVLKLK